MCVFCVSTYVFFSFFHTMCINELQKDPLHIVYVYGVRRRGLLEPQNITSWLMLAEHVKHTTVSALQINPSFVFTNCLQEIFETWPHLGQLLLCLCRTCCLCITPFFPPSGRQTLQDHQYNGALVFCYRTGPR